MKNKERKFRKLKKSSAILLAGAMLLGGSLTVFAHDDYNFRGEIGSDGVAYELSEEVQKLEGNTYATIVMETSSNPNGETAYQVWTTGEYAVPVSVEKIITNSSRELHDISYNSPYNYMTCQVVLRGKNQTAFTRCEVRGIWWPNGT